VKPGADQIGVHASMTDTGIIVKAAVGTDEVGAELLGRDEGASLRDHWQKLAG